GERSSGSTYDLGNVSDSGSLSRYSKSTVRRHRRVSHFEVEFAISVYDIAPLLIQHGYSFNAFVYRNLYQLLVAFHASSNSLPPTTKEKLAHTPTRGCLFDWNDNKQDILNSLDHPSVCRVCEERYVKGGPLASHMSELRSELYRIQRPLHVRGLEWLNRKIARHPWLTLGVAVLSGIALNLVASYLFEWLK
ncbi:hypothetical protein, partial [Aeromonas bivalvium]|uniref:hypothetical protein n=1 Tax=Aeromonas bivalvium TaxID=440079 RepID=UPI0038CFC711